MGLEDGGPKDRDWKCVRVRVPYSGATEIIASLTAQAQGIPFQRTKIPSLALPCFVLQSSEVIYFISHQSITYIDVGHHHHFEAFHEKAVCLSPLT